MRMMELELKLISCRDLRAFSFFHKLYVYAEVSIVVRKDGEEDPQQHQQTPGDREGGRHPEWNHVMRFDLTAFSLADLFVRLKLRCPGVIFGKRTLGQVHVPVRVLIDEYKGTVRYVSYQVRGSDGKPNGVLNFSYTVKGEANKQKDDCITAALSPNTHSSAEKVNRPSPDVRSRGKSIYPSLEDIRPTLPGKNMLSAEVYYPIKELNVWPPEQWPTSVTGVDIYHYPCQAPPVSTPGPHWHTTESAVYGCTLHGGLAC